MTEPQTGIQLSREAWTAGRMIMNEEQTVLLKSQADGSGKVKAFDERGLIGEGTHERFIIDIEKFQSKAENK